MSITLNQVRSYEYMIAANVSQSGYQQAIASSPVDMVIAGAGQGDLALNRSVADPTNAKLIMGYVNVSEAYASDDPNLFSGASLPSWFGNPNPAYNGIYTVQYWNPAWETQIFNKISAIANAGYNGVFLDVLSGDAQWSAGNPEGNPIFSGAADAMAKLVGDINAYVDSLHLDHPFYLIGNQPTGIATKSPAALSNLDAVFNEVLYWSSSPTAGFTVSNVSNAVSDFVSNTLTPVYTAAGLTVFGNDYAPLTDLSAQFQSFEYYTERGWTPSNQQIHQTSTIMSSGPFMFMATPDASTVQGAAKYVNFLSGGLTTSATLIGGDKGDFFIGGPGQNVIKGGLGNDVIYAHPESAGAKSVLQLQFIGNDEGSAPLPQVTIKINGQVASGPVTITSLWENGTTTQEVDVNTKAFGTIKTIEIDGVGLKWTDSLNFNCLFLNGASLDGQTITLSGATLNGAAQLANSGRSILFNQGGVAYLPVPITAAPTNTSDVIDGGGGTNTVVYRANLNEYAIVANSDGSLTVTAKDTAEGPDTLRNVQYLQFADQTVSASAYGATGTTTTTTTTPAAPAAPAVAVPHAPTGLADAAIVNGYVNAAHDTASQALTGTADAGVSVFVFDGANQLGSATADSAGHWSYALGKLADGGHSLTAMATNAAGASPASAALTFTVDTAAPVPSVNDALYNASSRTATITGSADPGVTVKVYDNGSLAGTATANSAGVWSFSEKINANGVHSLTETVTDAAGNVGSSAGVALFARSGSIKLTGGTGDDVIVGQGGDTLAGGGGHDKFVFNQAFGKETVTDFNAASDTIAFDHHLFTSYSGVMSHAAQVGTSTVITYDSSNIVTLQNTAMSTLTAADFLFI